jgi:excisionase family DNA binding protein
MQDSRERLLTAKQLASHLGVHPNYIYSLATSGEVPSYRIGGHRRFRWHDIEAWLERQRLGDEG